MNARQQKRAKKQALKPQKQIKKTNMPIDDKQPQLERLSGIMKGILVYRTEVDEMWRLIRKYPEQVANLNVAYA